MAIRVILADDHVLMRKGIKSLLEKKGDIEVVGESDNGREAVALAKSLKPDLVMMDVAMPQMNGIDATKQVVKEVQNCKVIALSMHSERLFVSQMLRAGACGYLLKDSTPDELMMSVKTVISGKVYLSPGIGAAVVEELMNAGKDNQLGAFNILSPRERETLQLIAEGHSTKDIAAELGVSVKTVEKYRQDIMTKLDLHSIAELTKYAIREGLTSSDN